MILFMCIDMQGQEHGSSGVSGANTFTCLFALIFACSLLKFWIIPNYKAYKPNLTICLFLLYITWVIIPVLSNDIQGDSVSQITAVVKLFIPFFSLLLPYNYLLNHGDSKWFGWGACVASVLFAISYFKVMLYLLAINPLDAPHMIISYYTLFILPFIFLTCGIKREMIFVIFTALVLITSIKRGGIIALGLGLVSFGGVLLFTAKKIKISVVLSILTLVGLLSTMFVLIADTDENNLIERFANMEDDDGSGRTIVWDQTIKIIEQSDVSTLFMGHGLNAVVKDSNEAKSAHNDFLEITYDYGIIGVILYILAALSFLSDSIKQMKVKSRYAGPMLMLFSIFIFLSMMSHIAIYTWFNVVLFTIGYLYARINIDARNK